MILNLLVTVLNMQLEEYIVTQMNKLGSDNVCTSKSPNSATDCQTRCVLIGSAIRAQATSPRGKLDRLSHPNEPISMLHVTFSSSRAAKDCLTLCLIACLKLKIVHHGHSLSATA